MTYDYYILLIGEYINCGRSEERLLADIGYPDEITLSAEELVKAISIIAAAADSDIKRLVELSELKTSAFAKKFLLPPRSLYNWCCNDRTPPEYLSIMIGYILISEVKNEI